MRALLVSLLFLSGCANMKPVDVCVNTGILMDLIKVDICGKVGDGEFNPEVTVEKPIED